MVGWLHRLNVHELGQAPGDRDREAWLLQSMGSQRAGHNLVTQQQTHSEGKESAYNAGVTGNLGSIPGLGRCPRVGNGNPLQYSSLENPMNRGAWQATVHGVSRVEYDLMTKPPQLPK